jgi:hypothetical protein
VSTTDHSPLCDEARGDDVRRWIPIVVPLLALIMVIDTYFIAWAVLAII